MLWQKEETWKTIRKSYGLMKELGGGFRTAFVQAAYSECYVACELKKAGFSVKFHEQAGCDVSIVYPDGSNEDRLIKLEVKHSQDNKDQDDDGHGYSSWVISKPQIEKEKFDLCLLVRDSLKRDDPDSVYVFTRNEIAKTEPVDVNPPKEDYYLWYSEYFFDICIKYEWMTKAANSLVCNLNKNPFIFQNRWKKLLKKELPALSEISTKKIL